MDGERLSESRGSGSLSWKGVYRGLRTVELLWKGSNICANFPEGDCGGSQGLQFYEKGVIGPATYA
jgi:hypothetical protein